jgi:hypothetical protein
MGVNDAVLATTACGPIDVRAPMRARAPTTANGAMPTSGPISAEGSIAASGLIPWTRGPGGPSVATASAKAR